MTCPLTVQVTPTVMSASATPPAPLTINVTSTAPVSVGVTAPALSLSLVDAPISVTVSTIGTPGPPGPDGAAGTFATLDAITAEAISGHFIVTVNNNGLMDYASANVLAHASQPLALTTGAWAPGVFASAVLVGRVHEPSWSWTQGAALFLGDNGLLTQTLPNDAVFQRQVGEVITPTTILFVAQSSIVLS